MYSIAAYVHIMKHMARSMVPLILYFATRWSWVAGFTPRPLYHRQRTAVVKE